ncbi:MAG: hypothetical protein FWG70_07650 [Oscillospiraceae bacterium]|nr:hypothetical protein [Oscillospiraceae bacterium]
MLKILLLEDEKDVASATINAFSDYKFVYVDNLIDFHDYIIHEKDCFFAFLLDLQLDLGSSLPISSYIEEIPDMNFEKPIMLETIPLYGWNYFEYIMRDPQFESIRDKVILITGHYDWLKDNKYLEKYINTKIVKKRGAGAFAELKNIFNRLSI